MEALLELVGADVAVPLVTGETVPYANLDYAASAPCLTAVKQAVDALLPWYSSVHRGAGFKSGIATDAYEGARTAVRDFTGARPADAVIFTRNTTDSMNLLASSLPTGTHVVAFEAEHHANLLPWTRHASTILPAPESAEAAVEALDRALQEAPHGPRLVAVTGASNVTGELWPYAEMAAVAHRHGARVVLDAAQVAPHRALDIAGDDLDYVAFSGHKLYAPYGSGVLIGRSDWLAGRDPFLAGGGAVRYVTPDDVVWGDLPDRQEAGSPNVVGAVALGVACRTLQGAGFERIAEHEDALADQLRDGLAEIPGVEQYSLWGGFHRSIGVATFNVHGRGYAEMAAALSAEHGIGVRHGCICAHPLMVHLLGVSDEESGRIRAGLRAGRPVRVPGAVRASLGVGSSSDDIARLVDGVAEIAGYGPLWTYRTSADGTDCWPEPDPRARPELPFDLAAHLAPGSGTGGVDVAA
jgi:selenocysteine lyase/cysteine desulfurase